MIVINPVEISDTTLTSSTIPEPDASVGEIEWIAGAYNLGDERILSTTHKRYIVTAASTTDDPESGLLADPPTWAIKSPTNRYGMFDTEIFKASIAASPLVVEVEAGSLVNGVAGFNIFGAESINVTMTDPIEGEVYNHDVSMQNSQNITNWYNYFFEPLDEISEFALFDLPPFPSATVKITITGLGDIEVGALVFGRQITLGVANYGSSVQLLDFSRRERDEFGNFTIVKRRTSKLVNYDLTIQENNVRYVFSQLQQLSQIPAVWSGSGSDDDLTLVYGYYKDYVDNISTPIITDATLTIEGIF